jgi:hypothetical protein
MADNDIRRFMAFVSPCPNTGCWFWTGGGDPYPVFWFNGRNISGQEFAHDILGGRPVPPGWNRDHTCQVKCCVNPEHIEAVTPAENQARKPIKGNQHTYAITCKRGHPKTDENRGHNGRCRACNRARISAWKKARRHG